MCGGQRRYRGLASCLLGLLIAGVVASPAATATGATHVVPLRDGTVLSVRADPFQLSVLDSGGAVAVSTLPGVEGPPVRVPGLDGPAPIEPLGAAGAFPSIGFVYGAAASAIWPLPLFTGNRVLGAEAGSVVSLVEVVGVVVAGARTTLMVRTDAPSLSPATVIIDPLAGGGVAITVVAPPEAVPLSTMFTIASPSDEGLYGLGARKDLFDQRGRYRNVWTEEQNASDERVEPATCASLGCDYTFPNGAQAAYLVQPSLHGSRGWTAWTGGTALSRLDLAASRADVVRWGVAASTLELHLAAGGLVESAIAHTSDVGRAPAPPSWVYGPWVDVLNEAEGEAAPNGGGFTGGQRVRDELDAIIKGHEEAGIPVSVLGVEGWHEVPDGPAYFAELRGRGYRLSAYWNPFHSPGNAGYDEAAGLDLFIEDAGGQPYAFVNNRAALTYAIDWTKPGAQAFWDGQLARSMSLGFEGWMHDFGEFVTQGMRFADGTPPELMHNLYPVLLHDASRVAADTFADSEAGFEPFFYVRSGFDGVQASSGAVFPGDETTDWAEGSGLPSIVPTMLNLVMGGFPSFTTDVGGYFDFVAPRTTEELLVRWGQTAALTPIMRVHNSTQNTSLYPHELEGDALDTYRRYARLKLFLAPLVDELTRDAARGEGLGPIVPLVLVDDTPAARSIDDQWLVGSDLLVAPVLEPGVTERSVYFPVGDQWRPVVVDADGALVVAGPAVEGGQRRAVPVTLADIPLFARVGATQLGLTAEGVNVTDGEEADGRGLAATGGGAAALAVLLLGAGVAARRRS